MESDMEIAVKRVKDLKILTPVKIDEVYVVKQLREHEDRFLYAKASTTIYTIAIEGKKDWDWFLDGLEYPHWKEAGDEYFGTKYSQSAIRSFMLSSSGKIIDAAVKTQTRLALNMFMKKGVPKSIATTKLLPLVSHIFIGYLMRELMPLDRNPYEPALALLETGYLPRRVNDGTWKVVYIPV